MTKSNLQLHDNVFQSAIDFLPEMIESDPNYSSENKKQQVPCYLYLLTKHQSTPIHLMPWRIMKYTCGAIDQYVSLVFYNGTQPYLEPVSIFDLYCC